MVEGRRPGINIHKIHQEMQETLRILQVPELPAIERQAILDRITLTQAKRFSLEEGGLVKIIDLMRSTGLRSNARYGSLLSDVTNYFRIIRIPSRLFEYIHQKTGVVQRFGFISSYDKDRSLKELEQIKHLIDV